MRRALSLILIGAVLVAAGCNKKAAEGKDGVHDVDDDDRVMNEAIAQARAHVDVFARELATAAPGRSFSVKKPFPAQVGHEHMWLVDAKTVIGGFEGRLGNTPQKVTDVKVGDRYVVARDELSDWMITDEQGRIWGGYTIRALLGDLEPAERTRFEQALQPLP